MRASERCNEHQNANREDFDRHELSWRSRWCDAANGLRPSRATGARDVHRLTSQADCG